MRCSSATGIANLTSLIFEILFLDDASFNEKLKTDRWALEASLCLILALEVTA